MKIITKFTLLFLIHVTVAMVVASVAEKFYGHAYAVEHIYTSRGVMTLWELLVACSVVLILMKRLWRRAFVLLIHVALLTILGGALTTHLTAINGTMHLRQGEASNFFILPSSRTENLDFNVRLDSFSVHYYPGTETPSDYSSRISILRADGSRSREAIISMNRVMDYDGYRFFQSAYDGDGGGTVLAVSYDPWGTDITYVGYALLLLSFILFFFDRNSRFRQALRKMRKGAVACVALVAMAIGGNAQAASLKSVSPEVAEEFADVMVLYQGRICPIHTLAQDFSRKLYKSTSHDGYNSVQVLCGWMFYPQEWKDDITLNPANPKDQQKAALIESLFAGGLLKMFPLKTDSSPSAQGEGGLRWLSRTDRLPASLSTEEWTFIRKVHTYLQEVVMKSDQQNAIKIIQKIKKYQHKNAGSVLPSERKVNIEKLYNNLTFTRLVAILSLAIGLFSFVFSIIVTARSKRLPKWFDVGSRAYTWALLLYLATIIGLRWAVMGSVPLTNGYEAMEFMTMGVLIIMLLFQRHFALLIPAGILIAGFALLVAVMGESDPPITNVMPVLSSPLLSLHVVIIMLAYALLAIIFMLSICALLTKSIAERLTTLIHLLHTPALFLLTAGIFIGAVWANVSWGSYWQWDPKETWALITMIVYAIPLHPSFFATSRPRAFLFYMFFAFISVLITYFGVNYILGGMHSYA